MASRFKGDVDGLPKQLANDTIHGPRNRLTPIVPGASEGGIGLCTPATSISFGVCASRSGSACVKQAACKAINSNKDFMIQRRGTDKVVIIRYLTEGEPGQSWSK